MENQHKKSNQLSLLNIVVIVCYLCLLVGTPISVLNFWTNGENEVLNQLWMIPACTQLLLAAIWWLARGVRHERHLSASLLRLYDTCLCHYVHYENRTYRLHGSVCTNHDSNHGIRHLRHHRLRSIYNDKRSTHTPLHRQQAHARHRHHRRTRNKHPVFISAGYLPHCC